MSKFIVLVEDVDPRTLAGEPTDIVKTVMKAETYSEPEALRIYNFMTGTSGYRVTMQKEEHVIKYEILHFRKHNDDHSGIIGRFK